MHQRHDIVRLRCVSALLSLGSEARAPRGPTSCPGHPKMSLVGIQSSFQGPSRAPFLGPVQVAGGFYSFRNQSATAISSFVTSRLPASFRSFRNQSALRFQVAGGLLFLSESVRNSNFVFRHFLFAGELHSFRNRFARRFQVAGGLLFLSESVRNSNLFVVFPARASLDAGLPNHRSGATEAAGVSSSTPARRPEPTSMHSGERNSQHLVGRGVWGAPSKGGGHYAPMPAWSNKFLRPLSIFFRGRALATIRPRKIGKSRHTPRP